MAAIPNSILDEVKLMIGQEPDDDSFDLDIRTHINSVFGTLQQLGVGPKAGFQITTKNNLWSEFTSSDVLLNPVKSYIYLRVRLLFDPPTNSFLVNSLEKQQLELEWRLNVLVDFEPLEPLPDE